MAIPKKVAERFSTRLRHFQSIVEAQRARDVSEADTVTIVKDVLSELFGYDKYAELTSEHSIRGTYCDLAVKLDGRLAFLIEVKAIGLELKENHVRQATDYAANQGCEWVVLTNGADWVLYHVLFKKPIERREVARFNVLQANPRSDADHERLFLVSREGFLKSAMAEYRDRREATSRYMLAAILVNSEAVVSALRREIRRVSDLMIDQSDIVEMLKEQVVKRDAIEGTEFEEAVRRFNRASQRTLRRQPDDAGGVTEVAPQPMPDSGAAAPQP